jgi:transcriptional regulator with XRE-family HTH domain
MSLGLRVQQIADRAELDRSTISTYEGCRARPSKETLRAWRAALVSLAKECRAHSQIALNDLGAE